MAIFAARATRKIRMTHGSRRVLGRTLALLAGLLVLAVPFGYLQRARAYLQIITVPGMAQEPYVWDARAGRLTAYFDEPMALANSGLPSKQSAAAVGEPAGRRYAERVMREIARIGACQTPEILGDVDAAIGCIERFCARARPADADLLLFPECFLQGYLVSEAHVRRHALDLRSAAFRAVTARLADIKPVLVIGVIERAAGRLYNSAVVIEQGRVAGVYRKTHLMPAEEVFEKGEGYPVFEVKGVRYGINICYDTRFAAAAAGVAAQGARVLLVPSQNMLKRQAAENWKYRHNEIRAERVRETGMWLVSADVTGDRDGTHAGYGPTSVMNPSAALVAQVPLMTTGMVIAEIPA